MLRHDIPVRIYLLHVVQHTPVNGDWHNIVEPVYDTECDIDIPSQETRLEPRASTPVAHVWSGRTVVNCWQPSLASRLAS
jgi:hypothetical protein